MNLDEFILKMRHGEAVELIDDVGNPQVYQSVSLSKDIKAVCINSPECMREDYLALVINNKLVLNDTYDQNKHTLDLFKFLGYEVERGTEIRSLIDSEDRIEDIYKYWDEMNALYARIQADRVVEAFGNNAFIGKEMDVDYNIDYDYIQLIAMGINNYVYKEIMNNIDGYWKKEAVVGYIERGTDYLKEFRIRDFEQLNQRALDSAVFNYESLYHKYMEPEQKTEEVFNEYLYREIQRVFNHQKAIYYQREGTKEYQYLEAPSYQELYYNGVSFHDILSIKNPNGEEIYNKNKEWKRLCSSGVPFAVADLIKLINENFDRYKNEEETKNIQRGDMVYLSSGHFGIVMDEENIMLDNGRKIDLDLNEVCTVLSESEIERP